jgi:hypothetical protein
MIRHIMIALLVFAALVISFLFDDPANAHPLDTAPVSVCATC